MNISHRIPPKTSRGPYFSAAFLLSSSRMSELLSRYRSHPQTDGGTESLHAPPGLCPVPPQARRRRSPQRGSAERARPVIAPIVGTITVVIGITSYPPVEALPVVEVAAVPEHPHLVALHQRAEADRAGVAARLQRLGHGISVSGQRKTVSDDLGRRAR